MITGVIHELLTLATAQGCSFPANFSEQTMETMIQPTPAPSTMYQDFTARRPLEIETFLGAPVRLAQDVGVQVPRIETLYTLLHNANTVNQSRPHQQAGPMSPSIGPAPRMGPGPGPRGPMNGHMAGPPGRGGMRPGSRAPSMVGGPPPPPPMRRGPSVNGFPPRMMNGNGSRGPPPMQRRGSNEGNDLEEFSHLMLYDNLPEGAMLEPGMYPNGAPASSPGGNMAMREREFALRQRELALREQEYSMRRRMPPPPASHAGGFDDDDDDDGADYFDPMAANRAPMIDPDNFDMMSVTSRRTRKAPSHMQLRNNPEMGGPNKSRNPFSRPKAQSRTSARLMADVPGMHESIMSNALLGYSSDRYGNVDRHVMGQESRTNSLTAERLHELQRGGSYNGPMPNGPMPNGPMNGPMPPPMARRASQSPGQPLGPQGRQQRPSPPNGYSHHGVSTNGRPSPPGGMRAPVPRHALGHGNAVAPQQVEQQVGVSSLYPPKSGPQARSLTGSASASAGSGDSNRSAHIDSEPSAHSSSSSLGPRAPIGVQ